MTGGQTQKANPLDQGRYVGNPNHNRPPMMASPMPMPTVSQTPGLQGIRDANGNLVNNNVYNMGGATNNRGQIQVGGATAPPPMNINSLAAQGIQGAGMGTATGMGYTPQQVNVAGSSNAVTPTTITGTNVSGTNVSPMGLSGTVTANQLANTSLNPYMNPYTDSVIKQNEADILRGAKIGLNELSAQAQAAGSFGGSRHGIQGAELGRGSLEQLARSSQGLRQANFQQAQQSALQDIANNMQGQLANQSASQFDISNNMQGQLANQANNLQAQLANQGNNLNVQQANQGMNMQGQLANQSSGLQDISNRLQASLANQSAGLQGAQQRLGAANQLGQLSNLGFGMGQQVNQNLAQQGAMQQALQQMVMDQAQGKFNAYANHPAAGLPYLNAALGASNLGENTSTLSKQPGLFDYLTLGASGYTGGT